MLAPNQNGVSNRGSTLRAEPLLSVSALSFKAYVQERKGSACRVPKKGLFLISNTNRRKKYLFKLAAMLFA